MTLVRIAPPGVEMNIRCNRNKAVCSLHASAAAEWLLPSVSTDLVEGIAVFLGAVLPAMLRKKYFQFLSCMEREVAGEREIMLKSSTRYIVTSSLPLLCAD